MVEIPDKIPGTIYRNIHRTGNDVYIVLGSSMGQGIGSLNECRDVPITLIMWADGSFSWIISSLVGDKNDKKL